MHVLTTPRQVSDELTEERLSVIGELMLDVLAKAVLATSTEYDCAYSRGALSWAWIKNALLLLVRSREHKWLTVRHAANDLVIGIGSHPVRFFIDDHANPRKPRVLNPTDGEAVQLKLHFKEAQDTAPVLWRFIVERALNEDDESRVFFVGYNAVGEVVAKWQFTESVRAFHATDALIPESARLDPIALAPIFEEGEDEPAATAAIEIDGVRKNERDAG